MHAIELLALVQPLGKACREPLPQRDVQMEWPARLPAQWFGDVEILEAEVEIRRRFLRYCFDGWARFGARQRNDLMAGLGEG
jgi:hypothetical protein